ncbi:MAG: hypothetical protein HYV09_34790 [Deltaproteobacteria bacterium]|nr:hypothetical protein [Deltaproteobacteria bacterium]
MKRALRLSLLAALSFVAAAGALWIGRGAQPDHARASDPAAVPAAKVARLVLAHGEVDGFATEIAVATIDPAANSAAVKPLASVAHTRGSAIRGAAFGDAAFVVAQLDGPRGTSYDGVLFRVEGGKVTRLVSEVARASTPFVTRQGRVLVARGADGPEPTPAEAQKLKLRDDELTIDDVDPITGATRTLWRGKGYQAFLGARIESAGVGEEIVVYHSTAKGAALFALDPASGAARALLPGVAPFARDFSFDRVHGALLFADLGPDGRTFQVLSLDLASLALRAVYASPNEHLMPFALPSGDVALSSDGDKGLAVIVQAGGGQFRLVSPLGDGSDAATHASPDGRWIALRHTPKALAVDEPPKVVAFDLAAGKIVPLGLPPDHFVEPLGFLSAGAAGGAP